MKTNKKHHRHSAQVYKSKVTTAKVPLAPLFLLVVIKLGLEKLYTPEALLAKLRLFILKLTGNANFPTTNPTIAQLQTLADDLRDAIDAVKAGNTALIEHRDTLVADSKEAIRQLSYDIQFQSHGDEEKITSAGFEVRKPRTAPQLPAQVENLRSKALGNSKIELRWKRVVNADMYVVAVAVDVVADKWELMNKTTRCNIVLDNMQAGNTFFFRVYAINSKGDGNPSDVVEQMSLR